MTVAIIFHDSGELFPGDGAYPAKQRFPQFKEGLNQAERYGRILQRAPSDPEAHLSDIEKHRIKLCDLIDMMEHGLMEYAMGNRFMIPIINVTWGHVQQIFAKLPYGEVAPVEIYLRKLRDAVVSYDISEVWPGPWEPVTTQDEAEAFLVP